MNQARDAGADDVHARAKDPTEVIDAVLGSGFSDRRVTDAVGFKGEERLGVIAGRDSEGFTAGEHAGVLSDLSGIVHPGPHEFEIGTASDRRNGDRAAGSRRPLYDATFLGGSGAVHGGSNLRRLRERFMGARISGAFGSG